MCYKTDTSQVVYLEEDKMAKLLFAEDDDPLRGNIENLLAEELHEVDAVSSGAYALELLLNFSYDGAILDWDLPEVSGIEICRRYRQNGGTAPILFLTGKTGYQCRVEGLDSGADDYLCKPFDSDELLARIRAMLRRLPTKPHAVLKVGAISYNPATKTVYFHEQPVEMQKKEVNLIEFFLRHPNEVFSVEAIVERVWSSESEISPETIRPYIKRMRDRLTDKDGRCQLVTVHGSGYKLADH